MTSLRRSDYREEIISAEVNHENPQHLSKPAGHSAAMFASLNCISHVFILTQGELKCNNLTSSRLISHDAVIHHLGCGVALRGSGGVCCSNQSGQSYCSLEIVSI